MLLLVFGILLLQVTCLLGECQVSGGILGSYPANCVQAVYFEDCKNKVALRINHCELLGNKPDEFYKCQCNEYTSLELCYAHCQDDPSLQIERQQLIMSNQARCLKVTSSSTSALTTTTSTRTRSGTTSTTTTISTTSSTTTTSQIPTPSPLVLVSKSSKKTPMHFGHAFAFACFILL